MTALEIDNLTHTFGGLTALALEGIRGKQRVSNLLSAYGENPAAVPPILAAQAMIADAVGPQLRAQLDAAARESGIDASFTGFIPLDQVRAWINRAAVVIVPSVTASNGDSEGLPTTVLEAQAMETPVVASRHSGIPEGVLEGKTAELNCDTAFSYSDEGQLLGHIALAALWIDQRCAVVERQTGKPFPAPIRWALQHIVLSHHGQYEFGSPKLPATPEAVAVHYLDNLDAKLHTYLGLIKSDRDEKSTWTNYHHLLGTKVYKQTQDFAKLLASSD